VNQQTYNPVENASSDAAGSFIKKKKKGHNNHMRGSEKGTGKIIEKTKSSVSAGLEPTQYRITDQSQIQGGSQPRGGET